MGLNEGLVTIIQASKASAKSIKGFGRQIRQLVLSGRWRWIQQVDQGGTFPQFYKACKQGPSTKPN
jgi:hypothetical protein